MLAQVLPHRRSTAQTPKWQSAEKRQCSPHSALGIQWVQEPNMPGTRGAAALPQTPALQREKMVGRGRKQVAAAYRPSIKLKINLSLLAPLEERS